jgi:hypothetical protein
MLYSVNWKGSVLHLIEDIILTFVSKDRDKLRKLQDSRALPEIWALYNPSTSVSFERWANLLCLLIGEDG